MTARTTLESGCSFPPLKASKQKGKTLSQAPCNCRSLWKLLWKGSRAYCFSSQFNSEWYQQELKSISSVVINWDGSLYKRTLWYDFSCGADPLADSLYRTARVLTTERGITVISMCICVQLSCILDQQRQADTSCTDPRKWDYGFGKGYTFSSLLMFRVEVLQVMEGIGSPDASQVSVIWSSSSMAVLFST